MPEFDPRNYPYPSRRNAVYARKAMACTSIPQGAQIGLDVMKAGGNAVDAAVAMAAAMPLLEPTSNGLGSDCFALVWMEKEKKLYGLNASGTAPAALSGEQVRALGFSEMPKAGWIPTLVPGAPAGWAELSRRFGTKPLPELFAPAVENAREGVPVAVNLEPMWAEDARRIDKGHKRQVVIGRELRKGERFCHIPLVEKDGPLPFENERGDGDAADPAEHAAHFGAPDADFHITVRIEHCLDQVFPFTFFIERREGRVQVGSVLDHNGSIFGQDGEDLFDLLPHLCHILRLKGDERSLRKRFRRVLIELTADQGLSCQCCEKRCFLRRIFVQDFKRLICQGCLFLKLCFLPGGIFPHDPFRFLHLNVNLQGSQLLKTFQDRLPVLLHGNQIHSLHLQYCH